MNRARYLVLGALLTITALAGSQTAPAGPPGTSVGTVNNNSQTQLLRILTPAASQQLNSNAVTVRFEVADPSKDDGAPMFLVQLDRDNPIRTSATEQNFVAVAPGNHSVTVALLDANNAPVPGGRASVEFVVASQAGQPSAQAALQQKTDLAEKTADADLPKANSPLPLISVIGFGILVGGIVSAMKTRS